MSWLPSNQCKCAPSQPCSRACHYLNHASVVADAEDQPQAPDTSRELAIKARDASRTLQALSSEARGQLLHQIADAIESETDKIMQENEKDCQVSI